MAARQALRSQNFQDNCDDEESGRDGTFNNLFDFELA